MLKIIRLNKKEYSVKKYNNLYYINEALASAENMFFMEYIPSRKKLRKHIIKKTNIELRNKYGQGNYFPVSIKDIKRMERPRKCEIPVNIVDVLEILIKEIVYNKNEFKYRAPQENTDRVSYYALTNTIDLLIAFKSWLDDHDEDDRPENDKYRESVDYVLKRLDNFDKLYPGIFNALFN